MSHFLIVDITNPKSTPLEIQATVPDYMIPFVPIIQKGEDPSPKRTTRTVYSEGVEDVEGSDSKSVALPIILDIRETLLDAVCGDAKFFHRS